MMIKRDTTIKISGSQGLYMMIDKAEKDRMEYVNARIAANKGAEIILSQATT